MPKFKRGNPKPPKSGRRKGQPNLATREIRELSQQLLDDEYFMRLRERLLSGTCPPQLEVMLHYYCWGKPKEIVAVSLTETLQMDIGVARLIAQRGREYIAEDKAAKADAENRKRGGTAP